MLPDDVAAWQASGRMIQLGPHRIFTSMHGPASGSNGAPTILILHGFPASSFDWHAVVGPLSKFARVIVFDFLGYGLSDKPLDARYSLFEQADLAEQLAAEFKIDRCLLVSHDMGDSVCAELLHRSNAGELPFAIDGVVLTNGSIFIDLVHLSPGQELLLALPDEPLTDSLPMDAFRPGLAETFSAQHQPSEQTLDAMLSLIAFADGDRLLPRLIRYIEERRANQPRWTQALVDYDGPMTAVWGEQDPIAVLAMPHRLAELRPSTTVHTWPDVGHWPSIEVPERLASAILSAFNLASL